MQIPRHFTLAALYVAAASSAPSDTDPSSHLHLPGPYNDTLCDSYGDSAAANCSTPWSPTVSKQIQKCFHTGKVGVTSRVQYVRIDLSDYPRASVKEPVNHITISLYKEVAGPSLLALAKMTRSHGIDSWDIPNFEPTFEPIEGNFDWNKLKVPLKEAARRIVDARDKKAGLQPQKWTAIDCRFAEVAELHDYRKKPLHFRFSNGDGSKDILLVDDGTIFLNA